MKKAEITVGGTYLAKVSGKLTTVRVDAIRESQSYRAHQPHTAITLYDITNLTTKRRITFRSAAKFRRVVSPVKAAPAVECSGCYATPCKCLPNDCDCDPKKDSVEQIELDAIAARGEAP